MSGDTFQQMVQSLLEKKRRDSGHLIQFSSIGADGAREATWTQPPEHPGYVRPANCAADVPKQWVFQVKFYEIGLRGWDGASSAVVADLKYELEKVTTKYQVPCHHYVLITNVPLTGARRIGTRDKITKISEDWREKIPVIEVWDASDLSRILDDNADVRTAYHELILPGDILSSLFRQVKFHSDRRENTLHGYLQYLVGNESKARAEEAGDDDALPLSKVFIDQTLQLDVQSIPECYRDTVGTWSSDLYDEGDTASLLPLDLDCVSSAFPLLWGALEKVMLVAGPGYGKSTITQFLALYHASRIIKPECATVLANRLKLPNAWTSDDLDASCTIRFPFRVELRRYAKWRKNQPEEHGRVGIALYIARQLIGAVVESSLTQDDIFSLISLNPTLLILDGLDEVPNKADRDVILSDFDAFLFRCSGENVDLQVVMSSRPQGYHGEFDRFQPLRWIINDLSEGDFNSYCAAWLSERIKNPEERIEAEERIKRGMTSDAVRRLATTLLQATVMLTIVRKKSDIPEERHKLFEKYVDVVFQREKTKNELISQYESELRLLHEMVGYQIHEAVARGEDGIMPEPRFKDLVLKVWTLIRGNEQFSGILNQELQKIYDLSTDRLVFLSGKGTNQADIDFVIQPYREYFAASYLSNHTEADGDKVFQCLVDRGPYWQQVLRFYGAIAAPARQLAWAYGAASHASSSLLISKLGGQLRSRRAVLFTLPEFGRFHYEQFRKVIAGTLPEHEWWTWIGQYWVVPIISELRRGEACRELWKTFKQTTNHSYGSKAFALWLFSRAGFRDDDNYTDFLAFVSQSFGHPLLAKQAIEIALINNLPVALELADEESFFLVLRALPFKPKFRNSVIYTKLIGSVSRLRALRILCTIDQNYFEKETQIDVWRYASLPVHRKRKESYEPDLTGNQMVSIVPPYWLSYAIQEEDQELIVESSNAGGEYGAYLFAIFDALRNSQDPSLYYKAHHLMLNLPERPLWVISCQAVLGPSPDEFCSIEDWIRYREGFRDLFGEQAEVSIMNTTASTFGLTSASAQNDWIALLFHPNQWDYLVSASLLDADFVANLHSTKWAKLAALRSEITEIATLVQYPYLQNRGLELPCMEILSIAVDLHNQGKLVTSELAGELLSLADVEGIHAQDFHALISRINNPSSFPRAWAQAIIEIALRIDQIDLNRLSEFYSVVSRGHENCLWISLMWQRDFNRSLAIIPKLIEIQHPSTLELAVNIGYNHSELPTNCLLEMNRRAVQGLSACDLLKQEKSNLIRCLLRSRQTVGECRLYSDFATFNAITGSDWHLQTQLIDRLIAMPQTLPKEQFPDLSEALHKILINRENYPVEFCAAALDALMQIDTMNCQPLSETDWLMDK